MMAPFVIGIGFVLALALTWMFRKYAIGRELIDRPNERSSHTIPTPRGGGLSVVVAVLLGLTAFWAMGMLSGRLALALVGASLPVAAIGFADDHGHISAKWRLLVHLSAGIWALYWLGGAPVLDLGWFRVNWGPVGWFFCVLGLVWLINLYNFMDGIDGIAGVEAITSAMIAGVLFWIHGSQGLAWVCLLTASASMGFLYWNWPPARIFMGDVGSGFLGALLGAIALAGAAVDGKFFAVWMILLAVFWVDSTITLIRRLLRKVKVYQAHREHAYQHASRKWGHKAVTLAVLAINVVWLGPLAWVALERPSFTIPALILAWGPLAVLAIKLGAGRPSD